MGRCKRLVKNVLLACGFLLVLCVKVVYPPGDPTTLVVIAPVPSFEMVYWGGEEGGWAMAHPNEAQPWWIAGDYLVICVLDTG